MHKATQTQNALLTVQQSRQSKDLFCVQGERKLKYVCSLYRLSPRLKCLAPSSRTRRGGDEARETDPLPPIFVRSPDSPSLTLGNHAPLPLRRPQEEAEEGTTLRRCLRAGEEARRRCLGPGEGTPPLLEGQGGGAPLL
jgi:hypothetical protein